MSNPSPERGVIRRLLRPMPFHDDKRVCCRLCGMVWLIGDAELHTDACDRAAAESELAALEAENADLRAQLAHVLLGMELALIDLPHKPLDAAATLKVFAARVSADASKERKDHD